MGVDDLVYELVAPAMGRVERAVIMELLQAGSLDAIHNSWITVEDDVHRRERDDVRLYGVLHLLEIVGRDVIALDHHRFQPMRVDPAGGDTASLEDLLNLLRLDRFFGFEIPDRPPNTQDLLELH